MRRLFRKSGPFYTLGQEIPLPERISAADKKSSDSLKSGKNRLLFMMTGFFGAFCAISVQLTRLTVLSASAEMHAKTMESKTYALEMKMKRADIVDRNGVLLATSLPSSDLYIEDTAQIKNPETLAAALSQTLPDLNYKALLKKLKGKKKFVYIKRGLTPKEQYEVNRLGFPQLAFEETEIRVYPQGSLVSHVIGKTDSDDKGIAGIEKMFNDRLFDKSEAIRLSLDVGVQNTVHTALADSVEKYQADGATAILLNAKTGEIVAMVSLPDYDPNNLSRVKQSDMFNTASLGVFELGSVMKLFNTAIGLDTNKITVSDTIDASHPVVFAKNTINDEPHLRRSMSIPEILIHSSNIGSARIALSVGAEKQQEYFRRFGFFNPVAVELPERARPLRPASWRESETAFAGFGYGVAISPLHLTAAAAALVNGGVYNQPSLLSKRNSEEITGKRVISKKTSDLMRAMMRLVVTEGTGRKANVPGYEVGGKTGSARQLVKGQYKKNSLRTSFLSAFPMDDPQYVLMVMLENPKGIKETYNLNTAAWNAVPTAEKIIAAAAPQLGIIPRPFESKQAAPYVKAILNSR